MVRNFGEVVPTQISSSSSDRSSELRGSSQNSPRVASKRNINITKQLRISDSWCSDNETKILSPFIAVPVHGIASSLNSCTSDVLVTRFCIQRVGYEVVEHGLTVWSEKHESRKFATPVCGKVAYL
ncbi:hypothetical protein AVEN_138491-1 [Araneus ventricosus]|uniref:Uncharacterized protein n=1 Tax=Araneus ventricosus TaxID=182803 RepID=A0A4Y2CD95_ARAVE|nr:hypothetical protein AVEN_138491-1 [Araneus ventricosus]